MGGVHLAEVETPTLAAHSGLKSEKVFNNTYFMLSIGDLNANR